MVSLGCKSLEYEQYALLLITFKSLPNDIPCMCVHMCEGYQNVLDCPVVQQDQLVAGQACPV